MGAELAVTQNFQERMKDRIRDSIGDLLSDEDLKNIIERGIEEVFFKETYDNSSHYNKKVFPPLIHQMVKECLNERMQEQVKIWIASHNDEVEEAIKECVVQGAGAALMAAIKYHFEGSMNTLASDMGSKLRGM